MKAKLRSYYVFSLYGAMRGLGGAFIGSVIFTVFWILAPLLVLGLSDEMTKYVFSRMLIILIPSLIFLGLMVSLIPSVIGGILLSALLHNNLPGDAKRQIVFLKGSIVGASTGFLMWWILWTFDPLKPPVSIEWNLFIYYSITGILSATVGGVWAAMKLAKDSSYVLKDN